MIQKWSNFCVFYPDSLVAALLQSESPLDEDEWTRRLDAGRDRYNEIADMGREESAQLSDKEFRAYTIGVHAIMVLMFPEIRWVLATIGAIIEEE